MKGPVRLD